MVFFSPRKLEIPWLPWAARRTNEYVYQKALVLDTFYPSLSTEYITEWGFQLTPTLGPCLRAIRWSPRLIA